MKIGVIAEENNDVEVLYELTAKLVGENSFSFSRFVGHGCGKLRRKCEGWAKNLLTRGCSALVVIHDLDKRGELELRTTLETRVKAAGFSKSVVLIPIQEIEAWLLSDPKAIQQVFKMRKVPRIPSRPERIADPEPRGPDCYSLRGWRLESYKVERVCISGTRPSLPLPSSTTRGSRRSTISIQKQGIKN